MAEPRNDAGTIDAGISWHSNPWVRQRNPDLRQLYFWSCNKTGFSRALTASRGTAGIRLAGRGARFHGNNGRVQADRDQASLVPCSAEPSTLIDRFDGRSLIDPIPTGGWTGGGEDGIWGECTARIGPTFLGFSHHYSHIFLKTGSASVGLAGCSIRDPAQDLEGDLSGSARFNQLFRN
jgi:hypothetical protein